MSPTIATPAPVQPAAPKTPPGLQPVPPQSVSVDSPQPPLRSPTRNRYFYGKLLDDHHLTLEQCYFLEQRRLLNRLAVGFGVLCGLGVTAASDGKSVIVEPGVAIDGLGREIVVPEALSVDPTTIAQDANGVATHGSSADDPTVTICLCYHECETEPVPALVAECDIRERCVNGLIRERFSLHAHAGLPSAPPYPGIARLLVYLLARASQFEKQLTGGGSGTDAPAAAALQPDPSAVLERFQVAEALRALPGLGAALGATASAGDGDPTLTELTLCCAPDDACVVLATVTPATDNTEMVVDDMTYTRRIMSNDALQEMLIGLTVALERCCVAMTPGSITVTGGDKQTGSASKALPEPLEVTVTDAAGQPLSGATVRFSTTGGGRFSPATRKTSANGTASSRWTLGKSGAQTATATLADGPSAAATATINGG